MTIPSWGVLLLLSPGFVLLWLSYLGSPDTQQAVPDALRGSLPTLLPAHPAKAGVEVEERYLVFEAHWGLSNQLLAMEHAMRVAEGLGRTLVIPDMVTHKGNVRYPYGALFDLEGLREELGGTRMVEWRGFSSRGLAPVEIICTGHMYNSRGNPMYATEGQDYWGAVGWAHVPVVNMTSVVLSRDVGPFTEAFADYPHRVLAFTSMFVYDNHLRDDDVAARMAALIRLAPPFQALADRGLLAMRGRLGEGGAGVHVRMGDFREHCRLGLALSQPEYSVKWANGSSCSPTLAVVRENLEARGMASHPVYVATDDARAVLGAPELGGMDLVALQDVVPMADVQALAARGGVPVGDVMAVLDQVLCAAAPRLLLNDFSTYSECILYRARGQGAQPFFFWRKDGKLSDENL
jgi:hypothetical protein